MERRNQVPDRTLLQKVKQRLMRTGTGSQCRVMATVRNGDVTFSGTLQFEHQRQAVLKAASGVEGVRTVLDQMRVESVKKNR